MVDSWYSLDIAICLGELAFEFVVNSNANEGFRHNLY